MIAVAFVLALAACGAVFAAGYLVGAKRGQSARTALAADCMRLDERAGRLEADLAHATAAAQAAASAAPVPPPPDVGALSRHIEGLLQPLLRRDGQTVEQLRLELKSLAGAVMERERAQSAQASEIKGQLEALVKGAPDPNAIRKELQLAMSPLLQRESEAKGFRDMMRAVAGPMLERERIGRELSRIDPGGSTLGELPRLLDSICERGGFETVLLTDEVGLPLATSRDARDVEVLAGVSALLLTVVDRIVAEGSAPPASVVVHDEARQNALYRIFRVGDVRFVLTAVSRAAFLAPEALDPALSKLQSALAHQERWS